VEELEFLGNAWKRLCDMLNCEIAGFPVGKETLKKPKSYCKKQDHFDNVNPLLLNKHGLVLGKIRE